MVSFNYVPTSHRIQLWATLAGDTYGRVLQDRVVLSAIQQVSGKTSVNTGTFVPGVYRVNPYDVYHEETEVGDAVYEKTYTPSLQTLRLSGQAHVYAVTAYQDKTLPSALTGLGQEALQKAHAKLSLGDLSLGEDLGELRETLAMLKNPLGSMRDFLDKNSQKNRKRLSRLLAFRNSGRFGGRSGKDAAKAATDTWLEFRYGWRPLVMLLGDLIEQARDKRDALFDPTKVRSVRSSAKKEQSAGPVDSSCLGSTGTFYFTRRVEETLTGFASVQYLQVAEQSVLDTLGLTPRFLPETIWELTSRSFVWDWFLTVGPWIQSMRINPHIQVLGNTVGRKLERTVYVTVHHYYDSRDSAGVPGQPYNGSGTYKFTRYTRTVNEGLPSTPLWRQGDVIDLYKVVDLLALLFQRVIR